MDTDREIVWLTRYTRLPEAECAAALLVAGGDFWQALYDLSTPNVAREALTAGLDPVKPAVISSKLTLLRKFIVCEICHEAWMRIDDEDLQASHPGDLGEPLRPAELRAILTLLERLNGGDAVRSALEMLYYWEAPATEAITTALLHWAGHYDAATAGVALRLLARFPEAATSTLNLLGAILHDSEDARRYDAAWALWTLHQSGHRFPVMRPAFEALATSHNEAERAFALDLLEE
ncbi:MAG: hypothetical protein AAF998_07410 [Bacteroidota bacterium]